MGKFKNCLTETGDALINKRAENLTASAKDAFIDQKRAKENEIRLILNEVANMEDLSIKNTQSLIVGEKLNTEFWVQKRLELEYKLHDLRTELKIIEELINEYFGENV